MDVDKKSFVRFSAKAGKGSTEKPLAWHHCGGVSYCQGPHEAGAGPQGRTKSEFTSGKNMPLRVPRKERRHSLPAVKFEVACSYFREVLRTTRVPIFLQKDEARPAVKNIAVIFSNLWFSKKVNMAPKLPAGFPLTHGHCPS